MAVSVTSKGQVTIPKRVRDAWASPPGARSSSTSRAVARDSNWSRGTASSRIEEGADILGYKGRRIPVDKMHGGLAMKKAAKLARVDTNILARYYLRDDAAQGRVAASVLSGGDVFVPDRNPGTRMGTAVCGGPAGRKVIECLAHLIALPGITVEDRDEIEAALSHCRKGIDFADALHLAASKACSEFLTFDDRGYARRRESFVSNRGPCATRVALRPFAGCERRISIPYALEAASSTSVNSARRPSDTASAAGTELRNDTGGRGPQDVAPDLLAAGEYLTKKVRCPRPTCSDGSRERQDCIDDGFCSALPGRVPPLWRR